MGRIGLLVVFAVIVLLYAGPSRSLLQTRHEAAGKRAEVQRLQRENQRLRARRTALRDPAALEREARRLGMVRPGEKPFVVSGLPTGP